MMVKVDGRTLVDFHATRLTLVRLSSLLCAANALPARQSILQVLFYNCFILIPTRTSLFFVARALQLSRQYFPTMPPKSKKREVEEYESDDGFIADAPKSKKPKATVPERKGQEGGLDMKTGETDAGEKFWSVRCFFLVPS